jgi:hypothetical protein
VGVRFVAAVLRVYSFVFHLTLASFLLGASAIAYHAGAPLSLTMLPFADEYALRDSVLFGVFGVVCTLLALSPRFKFVFAIWTAVVLFSMRGFFSGPYSLYGTPEMKGAAWLTFGALGAFFGACWGMRMRKRMGFF